MLSPSECKLKVRSVLTPDLLRGYYRTYYDPNNPTWGHCYAASEACYHLLGWDQDPNWKPQVVRDGDVTHWWLQHTSGEILDPTDDQYFMQGRPPPYEEGKGCGFLTKQPSARAQEIIRRVNQL